MGHLQGKVVLLNNPKGKSQRKHIENLFAELGNISHDSVICVEQKKKKTTFHYNTYSTFTEVNEVLDEALKKYKKHLRYVNLTLHEDIDGMIDSTRYCFNSNHDDEEFSVEIV